MVEGGVPFPMLTDPGGWIGRAYGVYSENAGIDLRGWFIVDPDGILQTINIASPGVGRNPDELLRLLKGFQEHRRTKDVIPAGWQAGEPTLKEDISLVGHVWEHWKPKRETGKYRPAA